MSSAPTLQESSGDSVTESWKIHQTDQTVFEIAFEYEENQQWERWLLATGDYHIDNPDCDRKLLLHHLGQARERGAPVCNVGDLFCVMQGRGDRRSCKSKIRAEHGSQHYFDSVVNTTAELLRPFAKQFAVIASGNHEDSVEKHYETNLIDRLCWQLRMGTGSNVYHGGYGGFVRLRFVRAGSSGKVSQSLSMAYEHSSGNANPKTQTEKKALMYGTDIVISGHNHDNYLYEIVVPRVNSRGKLYHKPIVHLKCPSYKDEWKKGHSGWSRRSGMFPKPMGAWWIKFTYSSRHKRIIYTCIPAEK